MLCAELTPVSLKNLLQVLGKCVVKCECTTVLHFCMRHVWSRVWPSCCAGAWVVVNWWATAEHYGQRLHLIVLGYVLLDIQFSDSRCNQLDIQYIIAAQVALPNHWPGWRPKATAITCYPQRKQVTLRCLGGFTVL